MWVRCGYIRRGSATHILPTFDTHARLADALYCRTLIMGSNYAHFLLIFETEPAVEFRSARRLSAPIFSGNHPHTSTRRFGNCPAMLLPNAHEGSFPFAGSDRSAYCAENCPEVGVSSSWGSFSGLSWRRVRSSWGSSS